MSNVSQIIRIRRDERTRRSRSPWLRFGLVGGMLISLSLVVFTGLVGWWYVELTQNLPSIDTLASLIEPPNGILLQPTRLYDRTHEHVILTLENPASAGNHYLYVGEAIPAGVDQAPQYLLEATIAELDPQFWHHPGYSLAGIYEGAHPTLAQRLISELVLDTEPPSTRRNIRERLLASQVTLKYGREKVLEWYINTAQYADLIYGADAAARAYFDKPATYLSLAEAAMLTAISETSAGNPLIDFSSLKLLQELIIQKLLVEGYVSGDEARLALKENVQLKDQVEAQSIAPAFTQHVLAQLGTLMPLERIRRGGFEIITSLDYVLQSQAVCTTETQLARVQGAGQPASTYDGTPCAASNLLPTLQRAADPLQDLTAEVVLLDPVTGQILTMVSEAAPEQSPANQATHPAGSILTPFLYLTAFTQGMSPADLLWDLPGSNSNATYGPYLSDQAQEELAFFHGPVSLRQAFANDYPAVAAQVLSQLGIENVRLTETQFGINMRDLSPVSEPTLDDFYSQQASLLASVQAYSILANQGLMSGQPENESALGDTYNELSITSILMVVDGDGKVRLDWTTPMQLPVVSPQIAYLVTHVLSDEKARWPSLGHPNALEIGRPAAARVSLSAEAGGAWAVGYIPQLAVGVWMGQSAGDVGGVTVDMAAGIWHALMQYASNDTPIQGFTTPSGISKTQVCYPSGKLVTPLCQAIVQEVFLAGNEPTQVDDLYSKIHLDRDTGLLATIFTPSENVDEKVFLSVPSEAMNWAKAVGFPIPPETYDDIHTTLPSSDAARFTSPEMFESVTGILSLSGSAASEGFDYYRLQVGQGVYPQEWLQIGEDAYQPVIDGLLGTWDTNGLDGLYVLDLLVVKQDKSIERAMVQVTIDNSTPQLQILSPRDDEQFSPGQNPVIIINTSLSDNQAVQRVEYYIDNKLEATVFESPWIILWTSQPGVHSLMVKAYDQAGNLSETSITFSVLK